MVKLWPGVHCGHDGDVGHPVGNRKGDDENRGNTSWFLKNYVIPFIILVLQVVNILSIHPNKVKT